MSNDHSTANEQDVTTQNDNPESGKQKQDTVPLHVYLEKKNEAKQLKKDLKEATESAKDDKGEVDVDKLAEMSNKLAEKHQADPELIATIMKQAQELTRKEMQEFQSQIMPTLQELKKEKTREEINTVFNEVFDKAIADNPEVAGIVNKDVIKTLTLNPENRNKTVSQIIEETYGKVESVGRPSTETTSDGKGSEEAVDFSKLSAEQEAKILSGSDPALTAKYNEWTLGQLQL